MWTVKRHMFGWAGLSINHGDQYLVRFGMKRFSLTFIYSTQTLFFHSNLICFPCRVLFSVFFCLVSRSKIIRLEFVLFSVQSPFFPIFFVSFSTGVQTEATGQVTAMVVPKLVLRETQNDCALEMNFRKSDMWSKRASELKDI